MKEELKNIIIMGLGAMSLTSDKAKQLKQELLEAGTKMYNDSKIANEELKHDIKEKIKENVTIVVKNNEVSKEDIVNKINSMSDNDKEDILKLLKEAKKNEKGN